MAIDIPLPDPCSVTRGEPTEAAGNVDLAVTAETNHDQPARGVDLFRSVFDRSGIGLARLDPNARMVEVNASLAGLFGWSPLAMRGRSFGQFIHPTCRDLFWPRYVRLLTGASPRFELGVVGLRADSQSFACHLVAIAIRRPDRPVFATLVAVWPQEHERRGCQDTRIHRSEPDPWIGAGVLTFAVNDDGRGGDLTGRVPGCHRRDGSGERGDSPHRQALRDVVRGSARERVPAAMKELPGARVQHSLERLAGHLLRPQSSLPRKLRVGRHDTRMMVESRHTGPGPLE
jgi:PAS domain S-box-containing protein